MRWAPLLLASLLLAGCAQLETARETADEASQALADAQREAQEARERYDRVKSATVVREERVTLYLWLVVENDTLRFDPHAIREQTRVENLTDLPDVRVRVDAMEIACEPLTCEVGVGGSPALVSWADGTDGSAELPGPSPPLCHSLEDGAQRCGPLLTREEATVVVRTPLDDVTE